MKKLLSLMLAVGIVACVSTTSNAQIIGGSINNGDLDNTMLVVIDPNTGFSLPHPSVWTYDGTRAITGAWPDGLSSEPWAGPAPTPVTTDGNAAPCLNGDCGVFFKAFAGDPNNGAATVHLYQDNPAIPGKIYQLTGWAGGEANFMAGGAEIALEFLDGVGSVIPASGDVVNLLPTLLVPNGQSFNYKLYTATAVAPAGAVDVRARASMIDGTPNPLGGGQAFVVDDFTLTIVPEPSSILLAGLSLVSMLGLRRKH
jgi:PEP-CTERM motif